MMHNRGGLDKGLRLMDKAIPAGGQFPAFGGCLFLPRIGGTDGEGRGDFYYHQNAERRKKKQANNHMAPGQFLHKATIPLAMYWAREYFRSMVSSGSERIKVSKYDSKESGSVFSSSTFL